MIKKIIFITIVLTSLLFKSSLVRAQGVDALSINVSPPVSYIYVKPGAGIGAPINLENQGRYTIRVRPQLVDFKTHKQTGQIILEQTSEFKHLSIAGDQDRWGEEFIIKPGESYTLPLTIAIPADFPQEEYHLSVLFSVEQMLFSDYERNTNAILSGIVASHLIVMVSLDEADRSQIVIKDFQLPKVVDSLMGIDFKVWAKNIGLNAGPIIGKLSVSHWPSPEEQVYEFYPDMVLVGDQRQVRGTSKKDLDRLKNLSEQEEVIVANKQDYFELQSSLVQETLTSDFHYKKAFLLGAYDFRLEIGDEEETQRVIALPFSILIAFIFLPILYRFLIFLVKKIDFKNKTKESK
jgi:hypothetical protein